MPPTSASVCSRACSIAASACSTSVESGLGDVGCHGWLVPHSRTCTASLPTALCVSGIVPPLRSRARAASAQVSFQRARIARAVLVAEHAERAGRQAEPPALRPGRARSSARPARAACARGRRPRPAACVARARRSRGPRARPPARADSPPGQPSRHRLQPGRRGLDLGRGEALVVAVVPLEQVLAQLARARPGRTARTFRALAATGSRARPLKLCAGEPRARAPRAAARPASVSGMSVRPVWRPSRLHSVSAWRTSSTSARAPPAALTAAGRPVRRRRRRSPSGARAAAGSRARAGSARPASRRPRPPCARPSRAAGTPRAARSTGEAQRDPLAGRLGRVLDAQADRVLARAQRRRAGEQRGDVPVGADARARSRRAPARSRAAARWHVLAQLAARSCARPRSGPSSPRMRCTRGAVDRGGAEQRLGGQAVVALLVVGRHAALVGEPHLDARPVAAGSPPSSS